MSPKDPKHPRKPRYVESTDEIVDGDPKIDDLRFLLWGHQVKATPARIELLDLLREEPKPIPASAIADKLKSSVATTYRVLERLVKAALVGKIDAGGTEALYEISFGRKHHHHAICTECGTMEDVYLEEKSLGLDKLAYKSIKNFAGINTHSLEFFGICTDCDKKLS